MHRPGTPSPQQNRPGVNPGRSENRGQWMNPEQIADVLDDAADYIEANGWHQGSYAPSEGAQSGDRMRGRPVCALGAIHTALSDVFWHDGMRCWWGMTGRDLYVIDVLTSSVGLARRESVVTWNDDPERTKQQVLDAFRAAAKQQRGLA